MKSLFTGIASAFTREIVVAMQCWNTVQAGV